MKSINPLQTPSIFLLTLIYSLLTTQYFFAQEEKKVALTMEFCSGKLLSDDCLNYAEAQAKCECEEGNLKMFVHRLSISELLTKDQSKFDPEKIQEEVKKSLMILKKISEDENLIPIEIEPEFTALRLYSFNDTKGYGQKVLVQLPSF